MWYTSSMKTAVIQKFQNDLERKAKQLGFDVVGFCKAEVPARNRHRLQQFIANAEYGEMTWLADTYARRVTPENMWAEVKSAVVLGMNYAPDHNPIDNLKKIDTGNISVYARGRDYHNVMKGKLKLLADWIGAYFRHRHIADVPQVKVFVDTAPLMEKALALQTKLGWQGKHTNIVSRDFGSWLFLGEILTTLDMGYDTPAAPACGSCNKCVVACPTGAIYEDYKLDARKCISYLTIEHKGHIAESFLESIGNRIYGCDDCLSVCPWNKFEHPPKEQKLVARPELNAPPLSELLNLTDASFRKLFAQSPIKRIGYKQFMRNVLIATGNSGNAKHLPQVQKFLNDDTETVQKMAHWAYNKLGGKT